MPQLIFSGTNIGTLRLSVSDVRLPESIKEKLHAVKEVRFDYEGLELIEQSVSYPLNQQPFFFEWQKVEFFFDPSSDSRFHPPYFLRINNQKTSIVSQPGHSDHKLYGQIKLADVVGFTDFEIIDQNGRRIFFLQTEVFPQKLDYKEDFNAMIAEISEMVYQLAYDYLGKTYGLAKPVSTDRQTPLEWISLLTHLFDSLENSLRLIIRNPQAKLVSESTIRPVDKIRRMDPSFGKWVLKHPAYLMTNKGEGLEIDKNIFLTHLPEQKKTFTYDRFENQFVLWAVKQIITATDTMIKGLEHQYRQDRIQNQIDKLKQFRGRLRKTINQPLFHEVSTWDQQMHYSSILTRAPGYRNFYHYFLMLRKGLSISQDDIFQLDYKRISTLYEYWCFLKMVKLLCADGKYEYQADDLIKVEQNRLVVNLKKGEESRIRLINKESGETIYLWFNRIFKTKETHTFSQIPDHVIEFEKEGYQQPFRFILDAKYRFDRGSKSYPESRIKHGPPLDAIAQLHRYRDAIISQKTFQTTQTTAFKSLGGLVLFPFPDHEEDFRGHKFFQSRFEVNIGAVPLQPGRDKENRLFKEFLAQLFSSSPEALYEKTIEYEKSDHHEVIEAAGKKVMIGMIPNDKYRSQRLSFHLGVLCYHTSPQGELNKVSHIALYDQKEKAIIGYGEIEAKESLRGKDLAEKGTNWPAKRPEGDYLLFHLQNIEKCYLPFSGMKALGRRYTSLHGLLQSLKHQDEQYLWLTSYRWLRAWQEIRKIDQKATFMTDKDRFGKKRVVISFLWEGKMNYCRVEEEKTTIEDEEGNDRDSFWE